MYMTDTFCSFMRNIIFKSCFLLSEYSRVDHSAPTLPTIYSFIYSISHSFIQSISHSYFSMICFVSKMCQLWRWPSMVPRAKQLLPTPHQLGRPSCALLFPRAPMIPNILPACHYSSSRAPPQPHRWYFSG